MHEAKRTAKTETVWKPGASGRPNDAGSLISLEPQLVLASSTQSRALARQQSVPGVTSPSHCYEKGSGVGNSKEEGQYVAWPSESGCEMGGAENGR